MSFPYSWRENLSHSAIDFSCAIYVLEGGLSCSSSGDADCIEVKSFKGPRRSPKGLPISDALFRADIGDLCFGGTNPRLNVSDWHRSP